MVCREDQAQKISSFYSPPLLLLQSLASGTGLGSVYRELETLLEPVGVGWCHSTLRRHRDAVEILGRMMMALSHSLHSKLFLSLFLSFFLNRIFMISVAENL